MCHKLPPPLNIRVFPELVVSARTGRFESIIVHIPIDIRELPKAFYSNGRNLREGENDLRRKTPVLGFVDFPTNLTAVLPLIVATTRSRPFANMKKCLHEYRAHPPSPR